MCVFYVKKAEKDMDGMGYWLSLAYDPEGISIANCFVNCCELDQLMHSHGIKKLQELGGWSFENDLSDPNLAFEYLILNLRCGGYYIPPSREAVQRSVAKSLARQEEPDFYKVDSRTRFEAFEELCRKGNARKLTEFMATVERFSGGTVKLRDADPKTFPVQKPHVICLELIAENGQIHKLVMRPDLPIEFVD